MDVRMPDGTVIQNIPDGTPKDVILQKYQASNPNAKTDMPQEQTIGGEALALGETALAVGSDLAGKAVAGLATPFMAAWDAVTNEDGDPVLGDVSRKIGLINDFIRVDPKTERGKETLESVAHIMDVGIKSIQAGVGGAYELATGKGIDQAAAPLHQ